VVLRWGVLGGIVRRVIKSRQFKDLRAAARLARHCTRHVFSYLEAGLFCARCCGTAAPQQVPNPSPDD
jgi:hypothetical protein